MKTSIPRLRRARWKDGSSSDDAPKPRGDVVHLPVVTSLDLHPDKVLLGALGQMETAVVIGWDCDGELYIASSISDGGNLLWLLRKVERQLLEAADRLEAGEVL